MINACWRTAVADARSIAFDERYKEEIQATHAAIEGDPAVDPMALMEVRKQLDKANDAARRFVFHIASDAHDAAVVQMASILARE